MADGEIEALSTVGAKALIEFSRRLRPLMRDFSAQLFLNSKKSLVRDRILSVVVDGSGSEQADFEVRRRRLGRLFARDDRETAEDGDPPHSLRILCICDKRRQKVEGRRQKAESRRKNTGGLARAHFCLLPSAFCLQVEESEGRRQKAEVSKTILLPSALCLLP